MWCRDGATEKAVLWVAQVWQQLNACLAHLGTHEALMGPRHFLACPVHTDDVHAIVRYAATPATKQDFCASLESIKSYDRLTHTHTHTKGQ